MMCLWVGRAEIECYVCDTPTLVVLKKVPESSLKKLEKCQVSLVSRSGKSVNVMSGDKKSPSAGPSAGAKAKNQQEIVAKFQQLRENQRNIATKITELDQDIKEHE